MNPVVHCQLWMGSVSTIFSKNSIIQKKIIEVMLKTKSPKYL